MAPFWSLPAVRTLSAVRACHAWTVRVLLVDDEERMVAALRRGLTAEGFVVESAPDGVRGLALAQTGDFDALVLDVMLPGLSGYEVVRRLRAADNWLPVLMLSAKDGEYDQADALDDGADDYLPSRSPSWCWWPGSGPCCGAERWPGRRCWPRATSPWIRPAAR